MRGTLTRRMLRLGLAVLAGWLVVGCDPGRSTPATVAPPRSYPLPETSVPPGLTPTPAPEAAAKEGWTEYRQPEDGFGIALPGSWRRIDVSSQMLSTALRALSLHNPALMGLLPAGQAAGSDIRFFAFDWAPESLASGFMTNLSVVRWSLDSPCSLAEFGRDNVAELEKVAGVVKPVEGAVITLPAGQAMRLRYQMAMGAGNPEPNLSLTQLLLVRGQEGYVLTFSTLPSQRGKYEPVFGEIGGSFRWLGQ